MLVSCNNCGVFEIGKDAYRELKEIDKSNWQIGYLQDEFNRIEPPVKISRNSANTFEVRAVEEELTKLEKKLRRGKLRGTVTEVGGTLHYTGEKEE